MGWIAYLAKRSLFTLALLFSGSIVQAGFFPYRYTVPEGSVAVFKNQGDFYNAVYPSGTYSAWPRDEGIAVSIEPVVSLLNRVPCKTVDGFSLAIPKVSVTHQINSDVLTLVTHHGEQYAESLIIKPVVQEVRRLCSQMTVGSIFLTDFPEFRTKLKTRLEQLQIERNSGLVIDSLELPRPEIPDDVMNDYLIPYLSSTVCQKSYDLFYALEIERGARERLCGEDNIDLAEIPIPEDPEEVFTEEVIVREEPEPDMSFNEPNLPLPQEIEESLIPAQTKEASLTVDTELKKNISGNHSIEEPVEELNNKEPVFPKEPTEATGNSGFSEDASSKPARKQKVWRNKNGQLYLSL